MIKDRKIGLKKFVIIIIFGLIIAIILFLTIFNIVNTNYINNVVFKLNGLEHVEIEEGQNWSDPSVIALYKGNSIIDNVVVNGEVNTDVPDSYEITYTIKKGFSKKILKRVVVVREHDNNLSLTLKGNDTVYILRGSIYNEPGYSANYNDLDLSSNVIVDGEVNNENVGEYILNYRLQYDSFIREVERKVIVVNFDYKIELKDNSEYVKENMIVFVSSDSNYDYVLMPDGKINRNGSISYKVEKNGSYTFVIYNKLGFNVQKTFEINNVDKTAPVGTCNGYMYDSYTKLVVDANDQVGIASYEYYYGKNKSDKISSKEYQYSEFINEAFVNVYDKVNNKTTLKCDMIDKSTIYPSGYNSYVFNDPETNKNMSYWLYIPKNVTKRNPIPLMIYMHGDGSRGNDINLVNDYAYPKFIKNGQEYPFMMLAGQINNETNWTNPTTYKRLMRLVEYIIANYSVNTKKIILSGGSSGGGGVYVITANYPKYFSCSIVGSGIYDDYRKIANQLIYTPMWVFHGTNDTNISYNTIKSFTDYINTLGGNVKFVGIEGGTHSVTETSDGFNNPKLIEWMITQERN